MGERHGVRETFLDGLFAAELPDAPSSALRRPDYAELIAQGGFAEMVLGPTTRRFRASWCNSYLRTVTALGNVEQAAEIRRPELVGQLLDQVAARAVGEIIVTDIGRELQASAGLVESYLEILEILEILETLYLVRLLNGWTTSRTNRAKRRRVAHLVDTALAAYLVDQTSDDLTRTDSRWFGPLLESFVVGELAKDARHLADVRDRVGERFTLGVVLHTGGQTVVLGDRLVATPIATSSPPRSRRCGPDSAQATEHVVDVIGPRSCRAQPHPGDNDQASGSGGCHHAGRSASRTSTTHFTHHGPRRPGTTSRTGAPCPARNGSPL